MKLCVLFPGIGYHCDKPLLYYSAKLAAAKGYEVVRLTFDGFDSSIKGNEEKMRRCAAHALAQSEEALANTDFSRYESVVFIGKSIGTSACLEYNRKYGMGARCILLTPLVFSFESEPLGAYAFHGTADPWADTGEITAACEKTGTRLFIYDNANHSLETGDAMADIAYLENVMRRIDNIL